MKSSFADSYFYLALLNPRDAGHQAATLASAGIQCKIVTTHWVLIEVADALSAPLYRAVFLELLATLQSDPDVRIIPADESLFQRGVELFRGRNDKNWTLTDCISFVVMNDLNIREAYTADVHFRQAGFVALMAE